MNEKEAIKGATLMLQSLGVNLSDPNYKETPRRLVESFTGFTTQLREDADERIQELFKTFPNHNDQANPYRGMLTQGPIRAYGLCSHHFLPIVYDVHLAYLPKPGQQLGFSKTIRIIRELASRPMNQEDFTQKIMDTFKKYLPENGGVAVIVTGTHFCMKMRGVEADTLNKTSAVSGQFKQHNKTKQEFLALATNFHQNI